MKRKKFTRSNLPIAVLCLLASDLFPSLTQAQVPVFVIEQEGSIVHFSVKASVAIEGKFDKWEATLTFPSTDGTTGVLDIKIQAASVNSGSGMKDDKLRSKDFFNANGLRPQGVWYEQRHSLHQDCRPRRGECRPQGKTSQRASPSF
jgi:polyisoprenoid-binding protein YceI